MCSQQLGIGFPPSSTRKDHHKAQANLVPFWMSLQGKIYYTKKSSFTLVYTLLSHYAVGLLEGRTCKGQLHPMIQNLRRHYVMERM